MTFFMWDRLLMALQNTTFNTSVQISQEKNGCNGLDLSAAVETFTPCALIPYVLAA